jgi:hypothetical protein
VLEGLDGACVERVTVSASGSVSHVWVCTPAQHDVAVALAQALESGSVLARWGSSLRTRSRVMRLWVGLVEAKLVLVGVSEVEVEWARAVVNPACVVSNDSQSEM